MPVPNETIHASRCAGKDGENERCRTLPASAFLRQQRTHIALLNIMPAIGTLSAIALSPWFAPQWYHLLLVVSGWLFTGIGVSVGYHRLFTHRSFTAAAPTRLGLALLGAMAGQGPVFAWVAIHRRHHEKSDIEGDPHSPAVSRHRPHLGRLGNKTRRLWHAHVGWLAKHDVPNPLFYAPDVLKDRILVFCNRHYLVIVVAGVLTPAVVAGGVTRSMREFCLTILWVGAVRIFVTSHLIFSVNSICHSFGSQPNETGDHSRNNIWLALLTHGEGWHNNHHAQPGSARFGWMYWQLDTGFVFIRLLELLRLASHVNRPIKDPCQVTTP